MRHPSRFRLCLRYLLPIIAGIPALLLLGDFIYARVTVARARAWEARAQRGPDGLRRGYEPFSIGTGATAALLIHGFGSSPSVFARLAPTLAQRGFTCRVMRLPGFGEPLSEYARVTAADWRAAVHAEVLALRAGHSPVWVVGHSLGGLLAVSEARDHPADVAGVVLLAPLFQVSSRRAGGLSPEWLYGVGQQLRVFTTLLENRFPQDAADPAAGSMEARDRFVPITVFEQMFKLVRQARELNQPFSHPVLLVVAPNDRVVARIKPARSRIITLDRAGHVVPLDYGWETIAEEITKMVEETNRTSQSIPP